MTTLVTGVAGFIGSRLAKRLLADGHRVLGVDRFSDYYAREDKTRNLAAAAGHPRFRLVEADLLNCRLDELLEGVDVVFHLAAQAGVRASWGRAFETYVRDNVLATQRLLDALRKRPLRKFVLASTSSVYGDTESFPTPETALPAPVSPYGVTKLAAEHLCSLYHRNFGVPAITLRYFTVYGPGQRPDMAFSRFIRAIRRGEPVTVFGDGRQSRDFTYVDDIVDATARAAKADVSGVVVNVGGGSRTRLLDVFPLLEELLGRSAALRFEPPRKGDARDTAADIGRARALLGYEPRVGLAEGLAQQVRWELAARGGD